MRKWVVCLLSVCLLTAACAGASASGVTLSTFTPFADMDFAAQSYMDIITAWEAETGNVVEDYSGVTDEIWTGQMREMIESGTADILIIPVGMGFTSKELLTVDELLEAAPDCGAKKFASMREADGSVLLAPVRLNWEALYINRDVLEANGLAVPATFDELVAVCSALSQKGIVPISNALCEWAEIVLDCAALSGAPEAEFGLESSLSGAGALLTALTQVGAFGADAWNVTDEEAEARFLSGEAAMRIDMDALAESVPATRTDVVTVMTLPPVDGNARTMVVGEPAFGLAVTRACMDDPARREAALSLVRTLLSDENAAKLATGVTGELGKSIATLCASAQDCTGTLFNMNADTFEAWSEQVIAGLMSLQ
ncbi:MAG: extracellular solute-binding protein [Clostridia bacterium]|nr:extracellular solute-binding protein [Clostridia bacterium]